MSKSYCFSIPPKRAIAFFALCAAVPPFAFPQDSTDDEEEIFELSPFEVDASLDVGYRAENTLSGSRLNSSLKDIPAAIDVSTKELLDDLAVNNFIELMEYQGNTQIHDFDDDGAANSGAFNSVVPKREFRTRGFTSSNMRDFIPWNSPEDGYNIQRFDFSKGPNGVLFGLGSVGGTANATTKRALTNRDLGGVELQFGNWGKQRVSADFNKVLVDGKLALRLNILDEDSEGYRYHDFRDVSRLSLSGTWMIAKNTVLRASYEDGDQDTSNHRPFGPSDQFSEWIGEGGLAPVYNSANGQVDISGISGVSGIGRNWANNQLVSVEGGLAYNTNHAPISTVYNDASNFSYTYEDGSEVGFRNNYAGRLLTPDESVFGEYAISDKVSYQGPDSFNHADWEQMLVTFEHSFSDNFNFELTFYDETMEMYGQNPGGAAVRVDLVADISDPTSAQPYNNLIGENSNYGEFYMENNWKVATQSKDLQGIRATAAYQLDLEETFSDGWASALGRHSIAVMFEDREEGTARKNGIEVLTSDSVALANLATANNNAEHVRNQVFRRNYVTFGDWESFTTGGFDAEDMSITLMTADGENQVLDTTIVASSSNGLSDDLVEDTAMMVAAQSFFLDGKLVATAGYREDDVSISRLAAVRDDGTDQNGDGMLYEYYIDRDPDLISTSEVKGISRTFGLVGHLNKNFSLIASQSSGRKFPFVGQQIAPNGDLAPGESGESLEYGIVFDLFDRKISGRILKFNTDGENKFFYNNGGAAGSAQRIIDAIVAEGGVFADGEADLHKPSFNGSLGDVSTEGYEFRLVGNPTKNITLALNYSYSERETKNILLNTYDWLLNETDYYAEKLEEIGLDMDSELASLNYNVDGISRTTPNSLVDVVLGRMIRQQMLSGLGFNERPHKANFTARYDFKEGALKGFTLGGSARWQDKNLVDAAFDYEDLNNNFSLDNTEVAAMLEDGETIEVKELYYGSDTFMADLMLRYRFKPKWFGDKTTLDLQLNVKNIFDETDILVGNFINSFDGVSQYRFQEPRSYQLTARFKF